MATWGDVRRIALALPGASEGTTRENATWIVDKKLFVWERPLTRADLAKLGERAPQGRSWAYPAVLVQLKKISVARLREVIVEAWLGRAGKRAVDEYLAKTAKARKK